MPTNMLHPRTGCVAEKGKTGGMLDCLINRANRTVWDGINLLTHSRSLAFPGGKIFSRRENFFKGGKFFSRRENFFKAGKFFQSGKMVDF